MSDPTHESTATAPRTPGVTDAEVTRDDLAAVLSHLRAQRPSRARSIAITKIEEALMWMGKAAYEGG